MSKVLVTEENLYDIANAIRSKSQGSDTYRPRDMAAAILAIPTGSQATLVDKTITQNGEYDPEDDSADGYSNVIVNVSNSYSADDEGKVVSSGALVAQTGLSVTENGTYDTTENNEVVVSVRSGSGGGPDRSLMNYHFCGGSSYPCALKENGRWLYYFVDYNTFMRPSYNNGSVVKPDWRQPFEIKVTFRITNTYNNSMVLFGMEQGFFYGPSIEVQTSNNRLWAGVSTSGSRWNYDIYIGAQDGATLPLNTVVWAKYEWDGTDITVTYHDGTNTFTKTVTPSAPPYYSSSYNLEFGGINKSSGHYARYIEFDLENTYIKQNGVMVWGCSAPESKYLISKTITANGEYDAADDDARGYSDVTVNVPNSYSAEDEGKVVSSGALVAQTSLSVTQNGTYDTTENNEVVVNLPASPVADNSDSHLVDCQIKNRKYIGLFNGTGGRMTPYKADNSGALNIDFSRPFEIHIRFKVAKSITQPQVLCGTYSSNNFQRNPSIYYDATVIVFMFSTNGTSWEINAPQSTFTHNFVVGNEYEATYSFDGTTMHIELIDGETKLENDFTPSGPHYHSNNYAFQFGGNGQNAGFASNCTWFDMDDTYIKIDGVMIWGCSKSESISLISKTITQNGEYDALDDGAIGYSDVTVNVSGGVPVLPPEYQEVEYVECYGAQYVLYSNIKLYNGDVIHAHASIDSSVSANTELGIIGGNAVSTFDIYFLNNEIAYYDKISGTTITNVQRDTKYELNGTMTGAANNICIGRYHSNYWHKGKIWRVTIEDGRNINTGNAVFRDFVPCYRKSDDEIGFYELVTGTFFPNVGTGAFGKGPDVT